MKRVLATFSTVVVLALLLAASVGPSLALSAVPQTLEQTSAQSQLVVRGQVLDCKGRWSSDHRYILTDCSVLPDERVLDETNKPFDGRGALTITLWGGTVGEDAQGIEGMPGLEPGEEVILMLRVGEEFDSLAGGPYGKYKVIHDAPSGRRIVIDADGKRVGLLPGASGTFALPTTADATTVEDFMAVLRASVVAGRQMGAAVSSSAGQRGYLIDAAGNRAPIPELSAELPGATYAADAGPAIAPLSMNGADAAAPAAAELSGSVKAEVEARSSSAGSIAPQFVTSRYASLPIVMNQFPSSFGVWYPEDQYQMSKWNQYSDIFRVYQTPTGTYGWPNGRFDMCGWPSSTDLKRVYGYTWSELGGNVLGVTFTRSSGGRTLEADVALNPEWSAGWTLDDEWVWSGRTNAAAFRQVVLHELGHVWGADHAFNELAVMNYGPMWWLGHGQLYGDDAAGVRWRYSSQARSLSDFGTYMHYCSGYQSISETSFAATQYADEVFVINGLQVENLGTTTHTANVRFYLSTTQSFSGAIYLGAFDTADIGQHSWIRYTIRANLPRSLRGGSYYLLTYTTLNGGTDAIGVNDVAISRQRVQILPALEASPQGSPASGYAPLDVAFDAHVSGGSAPYTYQWNFADGSTTSSEAQPRHRFNESATYAVTVRVQDARGVAITRSLSLVVGERPPAISRARLASKPIRLILDGSEFKPGAIILIDGHEVATRFKSSTKLEARGSSIDTLIPRGATVTITVRNPSGVTSSGTTYTRPGKKRQ